MTRNIALLLSYDGRAYHGWQSQANSKSIQDTLNAAACSLFNEDIKVVGCGRTDAGVHAKNYFASLVTTSAVPLEKIPLGLNAYLPPDISVRKAFEVSPEFHPVQSCSLKEYTYYIYSSNVRDPFLDGRALHTRLPLNIELMRTAAKQFCGTHDFSAVRSLGTPVKSTVRTIFECDVSYDGKLCRIRISANGFLYNMARAIVGTLLDVSSGKIPADSITDILNSCDRSRAGATAPAHGLYMTRVEYPENFGVSHEDD